MCEDRFLCHFTCAGGKSRRGETDSGESHGSENDDVLRKLASLSVEDDQPTNGRGNTHAAALPVGNFVREPLLSVDGRISPQKSSHVTNVRRVCTDQDSLGRADKERNFELFDGSRANHCERSAGQVSLTQHCTPSSSCDYSYGLGLELHTSSPSALSGSCYGFGSCPLTVPRGPPSVTDNTCSGFSAESFIYQQTSPCGDTNSDDSEPESLTCTDRAPSGSGIESLTCHHGHPSDNELPYQFQLTSPQCVLLDSDSDQDIPPLKERMKLVTAKKPRQVLGSSQFPIIISD